MKQFHLILLSFLFLTNVAIFPTFAEELTDIRDGKVVLPWTELKKLLEEIETLKKTQTPEKKVSEEPLPIDYSITKADFNGEIKNTSVRFDATFTIQVMKTGWVTIPFFSNEVGIENVSINKLAQTEALLSKTEEDINKPLFPIESTGIPAKPTAEHLSAQFVRNPDGYALLARGPTTLSAQVTFHLPLHVEELTYTLTFLPPRAVINHVVLKIPEKGVNLLQTTPHTHFIEQGAQTTVETVLSERDTLNLKWKIEKDTGISRKSLAIFRALASVDKSGITVSSTIILKYIPTLEQITLQLPKEVDILSVESSGIEQWSTEKTEQTQIVKLSGQVDSHTSLKIDLSYRLPLVSLPIEVTVPTVEIKGVDNFEGFLGVEALGNLEVITKKVAEGILIPAKNLPKSLWQKAANPLLYGYQFHSNQFSTSLNIKSYQEIQTVVANVDLIDCVTHRTLEGKSITRMIFFIRNNDRQFLTLTLPEKSHIWQVFLDGKPVKPAQKESGEILIPMKKSEAQGDTLQSFVLEIGYVTEVSKLTLKGDILNQLPIIDIPISYLRWNLYLPDYYEYSRFEGPLKQVTQFSSGEQKVATAQIDIPVQGQRFLFEKYLIVNEKPYVRGQYGQFLGDDIFLSLHTSPQETDYDNKLGSDSLRRELKQQVIPNRAIK